MPFLCNAYFFLLFLHHFPSLFTEAEAAAAAMAEALTAIISVDIFLFGSVFSRFLFLCAARFLSTFYRSTIEATAISFSKTL